MNIEGKKVVIAKSSKEAYNFFMTLENFELLMPTSTEKFEVDGDSFLFGLKGMPEIKLVFGEKISPSLITLNSSESKINFSLTAHINKIDESNCNFSLEFNGDLNPMIQMMVKTPLQSFINDLSNNISKLA